jgi:hypothetical protein
VFRNCFCHNLLWTSTFQLAVMKVDDLLCPGMSGKLYIHDLNIVDLVSLHQITWMVHLVDDLVQVICQLSSSCSPSDSVTLGLSQIPRALQPDRSSNHHSDVDQALVMAEMTSPTPQGTTGSQVQTLTLRLHPTYTTLSRYTFPHPVAVVRPEGSQMVTYPWSQKMKHWQLAPPPCGMCVALF